MKRHLKLRYLFIGLFGLMAMLSFVIIGWTGLIMNARLQEVDWIDKANILGDLTLRAAADSGRERGITAVVLADPAGDDGSLRLEMRQVREQGDRLYQAVIEQLAVLRRVDELGTMREVYAQFQQLRRRLELARERIDQALAGADDLGSDAAWQEVMNNYIAGLGNLRRVALGSRSEADHPFTENPFAKEILYTLIENAGRERVLVGTVIASGRTFTASELSEARKYSAVVVEAIRKVDQLFTQILLDESLNAVRERVRYEYQGRIGELREQIYLASERGEGYPLSAEEWFHEASSGIDAIIALSDRLSAHARGDIALVQYEARGNLAVLAMVGVMVLISLMIAVFLIYRRALAPLLHLEQAAHSIAEGDLTQPVVGQYGDELGEVAVAFEQMRQALLQDIAVRSDAEQRLRESEARYRAIFDSLQDVYFRTKLDGQFVTISPSVESLVGYKPDQLMQMSSLPFYYEANARERLTKELHEKGEVHDYELKVRHRDGHVIDVSMSARLLGDTDGRMIMEGLLRDITIRKQAENELRMMKLVLEQAADLVTITDRRGAIEYVNRAFEEVTGYSRDEVVGRPSNFLKSGHQDREFYRTMWQKLERGEVFHGLLVNRRKNGELFDEEKTISPVRDAEGKIIHYVSTGKNVTAKRQLEAQVQQSEKLASIGQLAAGVAHEINNPVGYINSNIGSLRQYVDNLFELLAAYEQGEVAIVDAATREHIRDLRQRLDIDYLKEDIGALIDESQEGVKRVKTIVQDLKDFSRTDSAEYERIDLHQGLNSTLNIVHNEIKYKAEVVKEFGKLPLVECVSSQINQVFMNLLVNASHAIEGHGTITIRSGTEGESQVWVEVEDTGKGISEEHLKHIFDPFFTTKPVGQGTGLGLSLSYGIIQKHGGDINVESEVGKGSRFRIVLPVSQMTPHSGDTATAGSLVAETDGGQA